jgi:hypothetical protein
MLYLHTGEGLSPRGRALKVRLLSPYQPRSVRYLRQLLRKRAEINSACSSSLRRDDGFATSERRLKITQNLSRKWCASSAR